MADIIHMPRLSDTMEEGALAAWLKNVGDKVEEGDVLAEIETDKATQEFESEFQGVLLYQGVGVGESVKVEALLAIIGEEGEDISSYLSQENATKEQAKIDEIQQSEAHEAIGSESVEKPEGIELIYMPLLSDTMTEGTISSWHKKVGEQVKEGDIIVDIETDKATQEFESEYEGELLYIGASDGESIPVNTVLAVIGPSGIDVSAYVKHISNEKSKVEPTAFLPTEAFDEKEDVQEIAAINESSSSGRVFASPLARKLAKDKGVNLNQIKGSGPNGRIVKRDVENGEIIGSDSITQDSRPVTGNNFFLQKKQVQNNSTRKVIAKRLSESKYSAPHYYLNIELDMEPMMATRKAFNELHEVKTSFNDWIVKAAANALERHPQINTTWNEDFIQYHSHINIGVAVAIDDGLLVPVVKDASLKGLNTISLEIKDKARRARDRSIKAGEMEGSTFTISNLGSFGIESFTSIINQPNTCILSLGNIVEKPVVKNGVVVVGHTMKITMACDHRVVDGATGSLYLQTLRKYIETPALIFT